MFLNPKFIFFAYKSSEIKYYLKEFDYHGGSDPNNIFLLFMNSITDFLPPTTSSNFPKLWKTATITPIPKCNSTSQFPLDYRLVLIKSNTSKVYKKFIFRKILKN